MKKRFPSQKIYISSSKIITGERGVFAKEVIKKGRIIEICPIIEICANDTAAIHEESLVTYMFYFGKKKERSLIALGYGSLYNHTTNPNAIYKIEPDEQTIIFTAQKNIEKDEEITVCYAKEEKRPLWFFSKG